MFKKIELYKNSIIKFTKINNIENIDYLVGIIFLSEMNKHCKNNNINYHGYYITYPLILLYEDIKNNISEKCRKEYDHYFNASQFDLV